MSIAQLKECYNRLQTLQMIGAFSYLIAFYVQENFYGTPNALMPLYQFLGVFQLSLTTFFGGFSLGCLPVIILILMIRSFEETPPPVAYVVIILTSTLYGILNTLKEVKQAAQPTYYDNFAMDIMVGWLACTIIIINIVMVMRKTK